MRSGSSNAANAAPPLFDLWGFAPRMVEDVKSNAGSFVSTIVETDWKRELETIQEALKDDTLAVEQTVTGLASSTLSDEPSTSRGAQPASL